VLAAEIIGFVTAFGMGSALRDVQKEIYQQSIPLYGLTDSYSFFSTVTQYNALREKPLSIEVAVVREAYAKFELANLGFVRTAYKLADPMTKHVKNTHLEKLLDTGVVGHPVEGYVTRAQMTHDAPFDEADMPSVDVSIFVWLRVLRTKKDLCRLPSAGALYMSWYCVLCCAHFMVLCFVLCTRHCPCQSCVLCVLVQGMVLHDEIENPWISLTSFLHVIWASRKII
jgi:hypothetical protein